MKFVVIIDIMMRAEQVFVAPARPDSPRLTLLEAKHAMTAHDLITSKRCRKCGETKLVSDYYASSTGAGGLKSVCKPCFGDDIRQRNARKPKKKFIPDGVITPDTTVLDANGFDWSWAFVWFKEISGFPGYAVSYSGQVWSRLRGGYSGSHFGSWRIIKPKLSGRDTPHYAVSLCNDGLVYPYYVHRLVLESFVGPCPEGMEGCHNDGDTTNNALWNLRWDTHLANSQDTIKHGRQPRGENHCHATLTDARVLRIKEMIRNGMRNCDIARAMGIGDYHVSFIRSGRNWGHIDLPGDDGATQDERPADIAGTIRAAV